MTQKHIIYIATDANRWYLEVDYTQDITSTSYKLAQSNDNCSANCNSMLSRIVFFEEFDHIEKALARKKELSQYTRMMKERLIRRQNPNWLNLVSAQITKNNKAAVYAFTHSAAL